MLDHRYERKRLVSHAPDRYNAIGHSRNSNQQQPLEFWTNGTTTLILNLGAKPVTKPALKPSTDFSIEALVLNSGVKPVTEPALKPSTGLFSETLILNLGANPVTEPALKPSTDFSTLSRNQRMTRPRRESDPVATKGQNHVVRNSMIAGSVAGVASTLACHPFDVIRTKMQSAAMESAITASSATTTASTTTTTGPIHVVSQTLKNGGIRALYTGLALPLAAQAVYKATVFTVNNMTQKALLDWHSRERRKTGIFDPYSLTLGDSFCCGFVGGGVNAALFVTPVEYVRNQLIGQHSRRAAGQKVSNPFTGPVDVIRSTLNSRAGVLGLWRGVSVTVARDSIGCGFFFYSMEWSQRYFATGDGPPTLGVTIFSGAVAGLAYWLAALPLDSVKTWVQSGMTDSAIQSVQTSMKEHGLASTLGRLFSGFQVAYARGIPSAAITVTTYSLCYRALQRCDA